MRLSLFGAPRGHAPRARLTGSFRPCVEALEDRALLSFMPVVFHAGQVVASRARGRSQAPSPSSVLAGPASGTWSAPIPAPGAPTVQTLAGSATLRGLGTFTVSGTLTSPGFVVLGPRAAGTLHLTNDSGSLTVNLVASPRSGPAGSASFRYSIVSGTGAYASTRGSGPATLLETVLQQLRNRGTPSQRGNFYLTFG